MYVMYLCIYGCNQFLYTELAMWTYSFYDLDVQFSPAGCLHINKLIFEGYIVHSMQ
jgi:hypothetical protein